MKRTTTVILTGAIALTGCHDLGLEYNLPLEEAMQKPPYALVSSVMAPADGEYAPLIAEGRLWVPAGLPQTLSRDDLQPVGASNGNTVYARSWDSRPYDELFTAAPENPTAPGDRAAPEDPALPADASAAGEGRFMGYAPVIGGGRSRAGSEEHQEQPGH